MIRRIKNKSLISDVKKYDVVLLIMGINNAMPDGFLRDISINFPSVKKSEMDSGYGDMRKYGNIFKIDDVITFYACYAIRKNKVEEDYLQQCLEKVAPLCKDKKVASILVGDESLYKKYFKDVNLYLYDDITVGEWRKSYWENKELREKLKQKLITQEEFDREVAKVQWKRLHGIHNEMPEGWKFIRKRDNTFKI